MKGRLLKCFISSIILINCACSNDVKDHSDKIRKTKYNADHVLIYEQEFRKVDTGLVADGYYKRYYDNGKLKRSELFKNGLLNGFCSLYYPDGTIKDRSHFFNDSMVGTSCEFDKKGNISSYSLYINPGDLRFGVHYDSIDNRVATIGGRALAVIMDKKEVYSLKDTVIFSNIVPVMKGIKDTLMITFTDNKHKSASIKIGKFDYVKVFDFYRVGIPWECINGSTEYKAMLYLYDSASNRLIARDKYDYKINVK